jgi:nucleoside-diphosphate-sugar epimerase
MISAGERIPVFDDGATWRDYTYIDDIVDGILWPAPITKSSVRKTPVLFRLRK